MPKKIPLNELLYEIDADFLRDIIDHIVASNPEIEDRIRVLITPKKEVNNSVSYYKKQLSGVPSGISTKSHITLVKQVTKPLLLLAKDMQKSQNYAESSKIYQSVLEILIAKVKKFEQKDVDSFISEIAQDWSRNTNLINDKEGIKFALEFLFALKDNKYFQTKYTGWVLGKSGFEEVTMVNLLDYYYHFFATCCKYITNRHILDQIEEFINLQKDKNSKDLYLTSDLYILKNRGDIDGFISLAHNNIKNWQVALLLKEFYLEKDDLQLACQSMYEYLEATQNDFDFKSGGNYKIAQDYLKLVEEHKVKGVEENVMKVLLWLISTGNNQWAYDVSFQAHWWIYYDRLKKGFPASWPKNYLKLVDILKKKQLYKQLLSICYMEKDVDNALFVLNKTNDVDTCLPVARTILEEQPLKALELFKRYFRSRSLKYEYDEISIEIVTQEIKSLANYLPEDKIPDLKKLLQNID